MATLWAALPLSAGAAADAGHALPVLSNHRAWLVTVAGARHVAKRAAALQAAYSDRVEPQSSCVRHSRYRVDCPFTYVLGSELAENYERCRDTGQVTEVAAQRFDFRALKPRCQLINNETP